ncbi:MAG TPA: TonB-dependent receptor [Candidatus Binatia bacterium]|nr:TonB-dependent receptor [Candidatus Binatia bacterium]
MARAAPIAPAALILAALCSLTSVAAPLYVIEGKVVDVRNGLPILGASVTVESKGTAIERTATAADGTFKLTVAKPGTYSVVIAAQNYEPTEVTGVVVSPAADDVRFRTALAPGSQLQTIARVAADTSATARTSTVTEAVNPALMQQQDILRIGDLLGTLPGVTANASSSSVGDDESISIRGFDPTETATLLDGHPIGPIGAQGAGFNYADSPFWGLREADVTFGSGATGIYGVSTIAGAVNFMTIDPTQTPQFSAAQGAGSDGQLFSALLATGTLGKFGYALAAGVQGTNGQFAPRFVTQQGLLGADNNGYPNITRGNIQANTYAVNGAYDQRNNVAKLVYNLDSKTKIEATAYVATSWVDHTGNGDNDYNPYAYNLYEYQQGLASNPVTRVRLPGGGVGKCRDSIAFLNDSPAGFGCYSASEAAALTAGPAGGGPNSFTALRNQDYHLRVTRAIGNTQLIVDGFEDNYAADDFSPPSAAIGGFSSDIFRTHGFLVADEVPLSKNDLAYGVYFQHQAHTGDTFSQATDIFGNPLVGLVPNQEFDLTSTSYFVSDQWTPNARSSAVANLWFQHSFNTRVTEFDPRLAYIYRPSVNETLRLSGGHSYSEPDPALLYGLPSLNSDVSGFNPICGRGDLNSIGSVSDPSLLPETATDVDLTYARRLTAGTDIQADAYEATEWNALLGGKLPLSATGFTQIPTRIVEGYLRKVNAFCHSNATTADLAVSTTYNAGQERYRGIVISLDSHLTRHLELTADYNTTSEAYFNLAPNIMMNNVTFIDGQQVGQSPLHTADAGLAASGGIFRGNFDAHYIGPGNWLNRGGFWYANMSLSVTHRPLTLTLGVNNVFNSVAANYGYVGLGAFQPENQYGTDRNSFDQGSELFGLPYRAFRVLVTFSGR